MSSFGLFLAFFMVFDWKVVKIHQNLTFWKNSYSGPKNRTDTYDSSFSSDWIGASYKNSFKVRKNLSDEKNFWSILFFDIKNSDLWPIHDLGHKSSAVQLYMFFVYRCEISRLLVQYKGQETFFQSVRISLTYSVHTYNFLIQFSSTW